jgi:hypothetical protein
MQPPIKPTKDDREKFRLQEEKIKSEELQKKLDAQKELHVVELKEADAEKRQSETAWKVELDALKQETELKIKMLELENAKQALEKKSDPEAIKKTAELEEELRLAQEQIEYQKRKRKNLLEQQENRYHREHIVEDAERGHRQKEREDKNKDEAEELKQQNIHLQNQLLKKDAKHRVRKEFALEQMKKKNELEIQKNDAKIAYYKANIKNSTIPAKKLKVSNPLIEEAQLEAENDKLKDKTQVINARVAANQNFKVKESEHMRSEALEGDKKLKELKK